MDGNRFDAITKSMAHGMTRRRAFKGLVGAVVAAATAGLGGASTQAQTACPPGQTANRRGQCRCPTGLDACPTGCFDRRRDTNNCGSCGNVCPVGAQCANGTCRCPSGHTNCAGVCVDTRYDPNNCGACGALCPAPHVCGANRQPGVCSCTPATCASLGAGCGTFDNGCGGTIQCTSCPPGQTCDGVSCKVNNGGICSTGAECASGQCVNGICCDQACDGPCQTCATGTCVAANDGTSCGDDGVCGSTCQAGACVTPGGDTVCADPVCSAETEATFSVCDGQGGCVASTVDCGLYLCRDGDCLTVCASDDDCLGVAFCSNGVCAGDLADGDPCDTNDQCQSGYCLTGFCRPATGGACSSGDDCPSGFCVEGICCDTACDGECQGCATGTCEPLTGDPCGADGVCGGTCQAGQCVNTDAGTSCDDPVCSGTTEATSWACDGEGACVETVTNCGLYLCSDGVCPTECSSNDDCLGEAFCTSAGVCEGDRENGEDCTSDDQCQSGFCISGTCRPQVGGDCTTGTDCPSGFCVEGVCCDTACDEPCQTCVTGTCSAAPIDTPCGDAICLSENQAQWGACNNLGQCISITDNCGTFLCRDGACIEECEDHADCVDGTHCLASLCLPDLNDGEQCESADECISGHCESGVCGPPAPGNCEVNEDCPSGVCIDNICCNQACDGPCRECSTGICLPRTGEVCGEAICSGVGELTSYTCNDTGECVASATDCDPYWCWDGECWDHCINNDHCVGENFCLSGECVPDYAPGTPCAEHDVCHSGRCVSGRCSGDVPVGGACTNFYDCANGQCVGGVCLGESGATCNSADNCTSGFCINGRCMGTCETCDGSGCRPIAAGGGSCNGGNSGICWGYCNGTNLDCVYPGPDEICGALECPPGNTAVSYACDGAGFCLRTTVQCADDEFCQDAACISAFPNGYACEADDQCASGNCVHGVCCAEACQDSAIGRVTCPGGNGCELTWCDPFFETYSPSGQTRNFTFPCNGVCCVEGQCCSGPEGDYCGTVTTGCAEVCKGYGEPCVSDGDCCANDGLVCNRQDDVRVCLPTIGEPCPETTLEADPTGCALISIGGVISQYLYCAPVGTPGEGICGGDGARCHGAKGCVSGVCCGTLCCPKGWGCIGGGVCKPNSGPCDSSDDCAGYCCNGQCVAIGNSHCSACGDVCPDKYRCIGTRCLGLDTAACSVDSDCASRRCRDGVCVLS